MRVSLLALYIIQGYDSLTEQSSVAPISRENARSGHNMISDPVGALSTTNSSSNALAAQPASWSHNPYYNPSTGGLELAGVQSPGLQSPVSHSPTHAAVRQQQQQLAAPGLQAMQGGLPQQWNAAHNAAPRQQQPPRTFSPLGGGAAAGSGVVSPDHVGLKLPAAAAAVANGNSWGSGSSGSKQQQQHVEYGLTSPRGAAHTQQQQRSLPPELAGGFGGGVSAQTEYHDAKSRVSEGSWASGREEPE
jgi:hypothetical protein